MGGGVLVGQAEPAPLAFDGHRRSWGCATRLVGSHGRLLSRGEARAGCRQKLSLADVQESTYEAWPWAGRVVWVLALLIVNNFNRGWSR